MTDQLPKCPSCGDNATVVAIQGNGYYRCDKCERVFTYRAEEPRQASGYPAAPPPQRPQAPFGVNTAPPHAAPPPYTYQPAPTTQTRDAPSGGSDTGFVMSTDNESALVPPKQ